MRPFMQSSCSVLKWQCPFRLKICYFTSGRILTGFYWFCILISMSSYTANLAAFLTVKNAEHPVHNIKELARSSYKVVVLNSSSTYEAFKTSLYETHWMIWHRIQEAGTIVQSTSEGIQWVREGQGLVFINDGPTLRRYANKPPCDLTTGKYQEFMIITPLKFNILNTGAWASKINNLTNTYDNNIKMLRTLPFDLRTFVQHAVFTLNTKGKVLIGENNWNQSGIYWALTWRFRWFIERKKWLEFASTSVSTVVRT